MAAMPKLTLIEDVEAFATETGLSDHRVGIILANNGRLLERLRNGRPLLSTTEATIRQNLRKERDARLGKPSASPSDASLREAS